MPLIVVTGLPSSGKTRIAEHILNSFQDKLKASGDSRHVRIISDSDVLEWEGRNVIYMSIAKEKELRSWLKSESQRYINLNQIVILDCAAYIKGFRYELFCIAKEAKTQYSVVELSINQETCWKWNDSNYKKSEHTSDDSEEPGRYYNKETFDALCQRYERCDDTNRWDSPLFKLTNPEDELDLDRLFESITEQDPLVPNKCTILSSSTNSIFKPSTKDR